MKNPPAFRMYTTQTCPYCRRAKALLKDRGFEFEEILIDSSDDEAWEKLEKQSGMQTVPQIWFRDQLIGGYSDLAAIDEQDKLARFKG